MKTYDTIIDGSDADSGKNKPALSEKLTTVILEGPMGKHFGRKWKLKVSSPAEALRLINANKPALSNWMKSNLQKYSRYRVVVDKEERDNETVAMTCKAKTIRFVPLVEGAGGAGKFVLGAVLVFAAVASNGFALAGMSKFAQAVAGFGVSMMIGGVMELLTSTPKPQKNELKRDDGTSYYFSGPVNTETQGVAIPLIYGTVLTGSHAVSASLDILKLDKPI